MKISVITVVYNRASTIAEAVRSVQSQDYPDVEHVLVDGASTDGTLDILRSLARPTDTLVSEPDSGIYNAIQKGICHASGDVVGLMHSDDWFAHQEVLSNIARALDTSNANAVYGDLDYVAQSASSEVVRHWRAGEFTEAKLRRGWMPPHPTLYLRREVIDRLGGYNESYRIAADYEAIIRYFSDKELRPVYLPEVLVKMRTGGESNRSIRLLLQKTREDYRAVRANSLGGATTVALKNLRKARQVGHMIRHRITTLSPRMS